MNKIKVFIDYPISDSKEFRGLSFPQVLFDFLKSQNNIELVGEKDYFDILFVISGGSHYTNRSLINIIKKKFISFLNGTRFLQKIDYDRYSKSNISYEKRFARLIKKNPKAKVVHRLDDRYRMLCKVYGCDETVSLINKRADATVFQTKYCKSLYVRGVKSIFGFEGPMNVKNGTIIYNGVDRDVFNENGAQKNLKGKYNIFHVSTSGMTRKGLGTVLEFAHLLKNNPEIQFYLVGRQIEDPVYGYEIKKFPNVHYLGHTNDRYELASFYRSGDVLLYPTINDCAPNVILEAMSCGMPVVAADSGGSPELILKEDIRGGILIDERNPIYSLKEVLNHLDLFKKRCVDLVKQYHTKEIMGEKYMRLFRKVVIVGTGLIGGSIALAMKNGRLAEEIVGISRNKKNLLLAKKMGVIDEWAQDIGAVKEADLVILSVPVSVILEFAPVISRIIKEDCIVFDVGSTKEEIAKKLDKIFTHYIGAHPLAGSEKRGVAYSQAGIFKGSLCILTPTKKTNALTLAKIKKLWSCLGARVILMPSQAHDRILSFVSHLPHIAAFSLAGTAPEEYLKFASTGFKDTTRIAASDAYLWRDIFLSNQKNILKAISLFQKNLAKIKTAIEKRDKKSLERILEQASNIRKKLA